MNETITVTEIEYCSTDIALDKTTCSGEKQAYIIGIGGSKKIIDFVEAWYRCILDGNIVSCDSVYDGNGDGVCKSGETCAKFELTSEGVNQIVDRVDSTALKHLYAVDVVEPTCSDRTPYGQCSATKPLLCSNGTLTNNCGVCGCGTGQTCQSDGACKTTICSDGTPHGQCSKVTSPLYCFDGTLINNCGVCGGCPYGKFCASSGTCETSTCSDGTPYNQCSILKYILLLLQSEEKLFSNKLQDLYSP